MSGALPPYVPVIHGGRYRVQWLDAQVAAVPLAHAMRAVNGVYAPVVADALSFRRFLGLGDESAVLVVGVGKDPVIERYWQQRNAARVPEALARLRLVGMTNPNYSFFPDVPRPHTLWNRARMHLNLDELSDAGVPVIPHLNAITNSDWKFWTDLLRASPPVSVVAKEFQNGSGNSLWDAGCASLVRMRRVQDELGRPLHPLLVGGARFVEEAAQVFDTFTVVDTTPYMKALKRQMAFRAGEVRIGWREMHLPKGEPIDGLLDHNVALYAAVIDARIRRARGIPASDAQAQLALSIPVGLTVTGVPRT